jgi:hypothetical protein
MAPEITSGTSADTGPRRSRGSEVSRQNVCLSGLRALVCARASRTAPELTEARGEDWLALTASCQDQRHDGEQVGRVYG